MKIILALFPILSLFCNLNVSAQEEWNRVYSEFRYGGGATFLVKDAQNTYPDFLFGDQPKSFSGKYYSQFETNIFFRLNAKHEIGGGLYFMNPGFVVETTFERDSYSWIRRDLKNTTRFAVLGLQASYRYWIKTFKNGRLGIGMNAGIGDRTRTRNKIKDEQLVAFTGNWRSTEIKEFEGGGSDFRHKLDTYLHLGPELIYHIGYFGCNFNFGLRYQYLRSMGGTLERSDYHFDLSGLQFVIGVF